MGVYPARWWSCALARRSCGGKFKPDIAVRRCACWRRGENHCGAVLVLALRSDAAPAGGAEKDIAVLDSTWDEGVSVGAAAKAVQVVILGTGEAWMQHAIAAMGNSFRGRAAGIGPALVSNPTT